MHMWQKLATTEWFARREHELELCCAERLAIIQRPPRKRIELEVFCRSAAEAKHLCAVFGGTMTPLLRDWQAVLQQNVRATPIRIGKRLLIVDNEEARQRGVASETNEQVLLIPAGAAFGTGEHVTTALCLRMLERTTRRMSPHWQLLDVGTGTGILALAARCFGADKVVAIDNYPLGIATARQNAARNGISGARFLLRDVLTWQSDDRFDVITANLFSTLLIAALPRFKRWLKREGALILSGVLRNQEHELVSALRQNNFAADPIRRCGKWIAILARCIPRSGGLCDGRIRWPRRAHHNKKQLTRGSEVS